MQQMHQGGLLRQALPEARLEGAQAVLPRRLSEVIFLRVGLLGFPKKFVASVFSMEVFKELNINMIRWLSLVQINLKMLGFGLLVTLLLFIYQLWFCSFVVGKFCTLMP